MTPQNEDSASLKSTLSILDTLYFLSINLPTYTFLIFFHEAMSSKNSKARLKAKEDRRSSYPLCLVCEYDHDYEEESIHQLYEKFQKGALHFEELDNEVRVKANQQKVKVLDALWKMDLQSRQRIADEIRKKNDEEIRSQGNYLLIIYYIN